MAILGNNLIVTQGGTAIASAKSCSFSHDCDVREISDPSQGSYKQFVVSRKSWKVSVSTLVTAVKTPLLQVGESYTLTFGLRGSGSDLVTGTAICTACKIDAARGSLAKGSFEFVGNGSLS